MIINGGSRCNGGFFAAHLMNQKDNERAELRELRGFAAATVDGAFREMAAVASGTRCKNYFYHANINPRDHEHLTPAQWVQAVDTLEKNLGLTGQPRMVFEHEKDGRTHQHVIWSRIDTERMRAISDKQTAKIHERTSRELEIAFDLVRGKSTLEPDRDEPRPERGPKSWETFRGTKSGIDPREIKAELSELWRAADSGAAFKAAVEDRGYILARGDRRDFCIVDHAGDAHSLARRLTGVSVAELRERMADIDRASLPSVAEARATQQDRFTREGTFDREAAAAAWADRPQSAAQEREAGPGRTDAAPEPEAPTPRQGGRGDDLAGDASIKVTNAAGRIAGKLADMIADILSFGATESKAERPERNAHAEHVEERERIIQALDNIRESLERGDGVRMEDLKNLSPEHLLNIAAHGDDAMRALVRQEDEDRHRDRSYGWER